MRVAVLDKKDITSPKCLPKVARLLEKKAIRIQYSLFFYPNVTQMALESLVDELLKIIDEELDDVRIYRVDAKRSLALMSGFNLTHPKIFL